MKSKLLVCLAAVLLLAGCSGSGSGSSKSGSAAAGSGSDGGGSGTNSIIPHHNPEPATMLLLGGGLAAYALLRRKHKK